MTLHTKVDMLYKIFLIIAVGMAVYVPQDTKLSLFLVSVVWIMEAYIEHYIEEFVKWISRIF